MQVLLIEEVAAKTRTSPETVRQKVREGTFPKPINLTERKRGWLESEVDAWIAERAAARNEPRAEFMVGGRRRFWDDVKAGRRPHPRTVARLRREAESTAVEAA